MKLYCLPLLSGFRYIVFRRLSCSTLPYRDNTTASVTKQSLPAAEEAVEGAVSVFYCICFTLSTASFRFPGGRRIKGPASSEESPFRAIHAISSNRTGRPGRGHNVIIDSGNNRGNML